MYIKNGRVLLENMVETFDVDGNTYRVVEIDTNSKEMNTKEYLTSIDLEKNYFEYNFSDLSYSKRFSFVENEGILCIEYTIKNMLRCNVKFKVIPLITYRDFYNMKNNSMLKFNQRDTDDGTFISISVLKQENLALKSDKMNWVADNNVLRGVKHELVNTDLKKEIYFEDLAICGHFEADIKGLSETKLYVFCSCKEFNLENINVLDVFNNIETRNKNATFDVDESFIELQDLAKSMINSNMKDSMITSLPYSRFFDSEYINLIHSLSEQELEKDIGELIDIVRAVEGKYLYFKRVKEAKVTVLNVYKIIKELSKLELKDELKEKYNILRLWYIEAVNRILQKEGRIELYMDSIKEILYNLIEPENRATCFKSIEVTALMLNAIKVYLNILTWIGDTDKQFEIQETYFKNLIENEFWIKEKNIMKKRIDEEESYANIEMIYTLSLSFPCVSDDIPNKLLDSIFKELYTPYGLRSVSKYSPTL